MRSVIITAICVAVLGGAGLVATYLIVKHQQVTAMQSIDRAAYAQAMNPIAQQVAEDISTRYKYSIIAGAVGVLIGIGLGVRISDKAWSRPQTQPIAPNAA